MINIQMQKFRSLMESTIKQAQLVRVKLKVDPALCAGGEIARYQGYEGYILAENDETVSVYLECGGECAGMVVSVPHGMVDVQQSLSPLERVKLLALQAMVKNQGVSRDDTIVHVVASANSPEALEMCLIEHGLTDRDIVNLYKSVLFAVV